MMGSQSRQFPLWGALRRVLLALAACAMAATAHPAKYIYLESPGVWKELDTAGMKPRVGPPSMTVKAGTITWNIVFQDVVDGNGFGFDDPVRGLNRRQLAGIVTQDLGMQLNYTGVTFDLRFEPSLNLGAGFLASAGTYYSDLPGLVNGISLEHAQLGSDPDVLVEDIYCTVDFGYNWHDDPLLTNPLPGEFDLYSVLLHEFTHGLGFASLATSSGGTVPPFANPAYTRVNDLLARSNGFDLWSVPGPPFFKGTASDLISNDVVFMGQQATAAYGGTPPPIYSSSPFLPGTSLSHWRLAISGGAVMIPSISAGITNRTYAPADLGALRDIGWQLAGTPFPTPLPPNPATDWNLYE